MELIASLHAGLGTVVALLKMLLESVSVLCVGLGLIMSLKLAMPRFNRKSPYPPHLSIRLKFGTWLALALEFQLGADIVASTVAPSFQSLGQLAILAAIRTFLNFFLRKELADEEKRLATPPPETAKPA
jgi:uncharacterized membrane protein